MGTHHPDEFRALRNHSRNSPTRFVQEFYHLSGRYLGIHFYRLDELLLVGKAFINIDVVCATLCAIVCAILGVIGAILGVIGAILGVIGAILRFYVFIQLVAEWYRDL